MLTKRRPSPPPCARFAVVSDAGTLFEAIEAYTITINQARETLQEAQEDGKAVYYACSDQEWLYQIITRKERP